MARTWAVRLAAIDVDAVGQRFPRAVDAGHLRLAAQLALGADFAGDGGDLVGHGGQRVAHAVDRLRQGADLTADDDGDLLGQIAIGDGGGDLGDVADLTGEVGGHRVDRVGDGSPAAVGAWHRGLAAELAFGAHFAGDRGDLVGEDGQGLDHAVDHLARAQEGAFQRPAVDIQRDALRQIASGDGIQDPVTVGRPCQIRVAELAPSSLAWDWVNRRTPDSVADCARRRR